jgi:salicylate hydroxylase
MKFADGSVAEADAIIGCDGVRSRTRAIMVGEDHPAAMASYTHKYAYRGLVPMPQASMALGAERAMNATCWVRGRPANPLLHCPVTNTTLEGLTKICSWGRTGTV